MATNVKLSFPPRHHDTDNVGGFYHAIHIGVRRRGETENGRERRHAAAVSAESSAAADCRPT